MTHRLPIASLVVAALVATPVVAHEAPATPDFVTRGLEWLVSAQHPSGGWGAGSHAAQDIRNPHAVQTDPATTSFAAMALLRAGHTPVSGEYQKNVRRATEHILDVVDAAPDGPRITNVSGTQPQSKMGQLVDTSMAVQFLSRVLTTLPKSDPLRMRADAALEICLDKLLESQLDNGSWGQGGWAGVLQSSLGCSALELAAVAGKEVDEDAIATARDHQKGNYDRKSGRADAADGAGVELYAYSSAQRASASEARAATDIVEKAKAEGKLSANAPVDEESLLKAGVGGKRARLLSEAFGDNESQMQRINDDSMLSGFGSNGGEEYLSYLMTAESLVIAGGDEWTTWRDKMSTRLAKIQSPNGSWTGHHCITSPVFCTAAVLQCLTADRDADLLVAISAKDVNAPSVKAGS